MTDIMNLNPTVCVVGKDYQIMLVIEQDALLSIRVGDNTYYDHNNGIRRSSAGVHRITVPASELDKARSYTVAAQKMIERRAYFSKVGPVVEKNTVINHWKKQVILIYIIFQMYMAIWNKQ